MQEKDPNFVETDPMLEIKMLVNCYGNIEETIKGYISQNGIKFKTRILYGIERR